MRAERGEFTLLLRELLCQRKIIGRRPHLESVSTGVERDPEWESCNFAQDCLRAHNLYRARHTSPPLNLSKKLCNLAQAWANHLAQNGILRFKGDPEYGENVFCRNVGLALKSRLTIPDITGEEVAAYWYSNVRQYRFNLPDTALQAHAGSYSQMIWKEAKDFGVGKAISRGGKIVVVAHYHPAGNISNEFRDNVLPLSTRALAAEMLGQGQALMEEAMADPGEEEEQSLHKALINVGMGVSGVLAAQPPNITGRNATKILAAHMLGHAAAVITTPEEKLEVVIVTRKSLKRKKSKAFTEQLKKEGSSSSLKSLNGDKRESDGEFPRIDKTLKDIINTKLREQESLSAPNILSPAGVGKRLRLSEMKRVKFKSEENVHFCDRSKAVQTSFSSENLSTDEGNFDALVSRLPSAYQEENETTSEWSHSASSGLSLNTNTGSSSGSTDDDTGSTTYSRSCSYARRSHAALDTEDVSQIPSTSQYQTTSDTSLGPTPLSSGEFSTNMYSSYSSSNSEFPDASGVFKPKKCQVRKVSSELKGKHLSEESVTSGSWGSRLESSANSDTNGSSRLNLPYNSPSEESGLLNCFALSPLNY